MKTSLSTPPDMPQPPTASLTERVLRFLEHREPANPNQRALSRITPPPTISGQRRTVRLRLMQMQAELAAESTNALDCTEVERVRGKL